MKQSKVIQISVFGILFLISLFIWNYMLVGRNNKGVTETSQATIPLLTVSADGKNINQLHGYQEVLMHPRSVTVSHQFMRMK